MSIKVILLGGARFVDMNLTERVGKVIMATLGPNDTEITVDEDDKDPNKYWFDHKGAECIVARKDIRRPDGSKLVRKGDRIRLRKNGKDDRRVPDYADGHWTKMVREPTAALIKGQPPLYVCMIGTVPVAVTAANFTEVDMVNDGEMEV